MPTSFFKQKTAFCIALGIVALFQFLSFKEHAVAASSRRNQVQNVVSVKANLLHQYMSEGLKIEDLSEFDLNMKLEAVRSDATKFFSETSFDTLGQIFEALIRPEYNNAMVLGQPGVGKSFLINQLTALFGFGVLPDVLEKKMGLDLEVFKEARKAFVGNSRVILVNNRLLSANPGKSSDPHMDQKMRIQMVLNGLVSAAEKEFKSSGHRTLFVFDEVATLPADVQNTLKNLLDKSGFKDPLDGFQKALDVGYSVIAMTTPDEYRKMVGNDGAVERRYLKVLLREISREKAFALLIERADSLSKRYKIDIDVEDLEYLVNMRHILNDPPVAMPASILSAVNDLFIWYARARTGSAKITLADTRKFVMARAGFSPLWLPGPNGEPPLFGLEARLKAKVKDQDELIDLICRRLKAWARLDFGGEVPVFILAGPSGSGKDTLIRALNEELYGHDGKDFIFSIAGVGGFAMESLIEGPPVGNHSDASDPLIVQKMNEVQKPAVLVFNEGKDAATSELNKLKVFLESGEIHPKGRDSRTRPLRTPVFILGQWGEELFANKSDTETTKIYEALNQGQIEESLLNPTNVASGVGAIPYALLQRAKKTGGVYMTRPVRAVAFGSIVEGLLPKVVERLRINSNFKLEVTPALIKFVADHSAATKEGPRGLSARLQDFTVSAISEAMEKGLTSPGDIAIDFNGTEVVVKSTASAGGMFSSSTQVNEWKFKPEQLSREKLCKTLF